MLKFYSEKDVRKLVLRIKEEYEAVLTRQRELTERIKEENRTLRAQLSVLEGEREQVSSALVHAVQEGERIVVAGSAEVENRSRELLLLAEKCRLLSDRLLQKYPDEGDCMEFAAFTRVLQARLGKATEEEGFDMEAVLAPKEPLDLEKLCKEMGVLEDL